jgi:1,4-dihydroxy-2-naphthoate octaprenyltransferase
MSAARIWFMAARPRTLPAALAPVLVGSAAAFHQLQELTSEPGDAFRWGAFAAALIGAIFIQVGTNLANDYSDAKRGADTVDRLGPVRVTASGLAAPKRVLHATWAAFGIAALAGVYLAFEVGPEILAIGVLSIAAGVLYTGGPKPYGYEGLGEVFVFVFFGLVAVNGSYYVQLEQIDLAPVLLSIPVGLLSAAILVVNNVRDIDTDRRAGKRTLAVRLGRERTRSLYAAMIVLSYVLLPAVLLAGGRWAPALAAVASAPLAIGPLRAVRESTDGPALNAALAGTGALLGAWALLAAIALAL